MPESNVYPCFSISKPITTMGMLKLSPLCVRPVNKVFYIYDAFLKIIELVRLKCPISPVVILYFLVFLSFPAITDGWKSVRI